MTQHSTRAPNVNGKTVFSTKMAEYLEFSKPFFNLKGDERGKFILYFFNAFDLKIHLVRLSRLREPAVSRLILISLATFL